VTADNGAPLTHVWRDGALLPPEQAVVSVWDHGFLYGDGAFEGVSLHASRLFRLDDHLRRLRRSARILAMEPTYDDAGIRAAIVDCCRANELTDAHVRIILTRGVGRPGIDPTRCPRPSLYVLAYPFPPLLGTDPIDLMTSSVTRKSPRSVDAAVKSLNYLDGILAKLQAHAAGAADALMLDGEGYVAEATTANVFAVLGEEVVTPEPTAALAGITRDTVIRLTREADLVVSERRISVGELITADEVFLTGTAAGIVPVGAIDGRALPSPPGRTTSWVSGAYAEARTSARWSEPI